MIIFRVAFLASIAHAKKASWRHGKNHDAVPTGSSQFEVAAGYLCFVAAFVAPYLAAWGTERRLMPLVLPTLFYLWYVAERDVDPNRVVRDQSLASDSVSPASPQTNRE
jgi:hypothetical protein